MDEVEITRNIEDAGFVPKRRNMHYELLGDPIFWETTIPRMPALATARDHGLAGTGVEVEKYPARSRQEKVRRRGSREDSDPIRTS